MAKPLVFSSVALVLFLGCAGEDPLTATTTADAEQSGSGPEGRESSNAEDGREVTEEETQLPVDLEQALAREALAPGRTPTIYPAAPYGYAEGSTVPNFDFLGWPEPAVSNYDRNLVENVDLARFYDPDGSKGIELLMVSAVAVWCGVCQVEYADLREDGTYEAFHDRGLEMLGVLFEDADAGPADYDDLVNWSRVFEVNFPFVLDPGFKMGALFDRSATPMNMVVDARTMEILIAVTGYNPELYDYIDRELERRGR